MVGQMTLFDLASTEDREQFNIQLPDVGEYPKDMLLEFEKEVLGIYVSGHPLEEDIALMKRHTSNITTDFYLDEETGLPKVADKEQIIIGGLISEKKIKYTKNDNVMAFLQVEDLVGTVEVIVFPKIYEESSSKLNEDSKVFIRGHASVEEDKDAKLIADKITSFGEIPKTLWLQFEDLSAYENSEKDLLSAISGNEGHDAIGIFIRNTKQMKKLSSKFNINADAALLEKLGALIGSENVKIS